MGYAARFYPQEWDNGELYAAEPYSGIDWPLTDDEAAVAIGDWTDTGDLSFLRKHPGAPAAVKEWPGPFCIRIIAPDGLEVPYLV
ncbi:hypothetical protein ACT17_28330 [Mycolicibacterium conceptionense]|uniref:Uncharacterized protein n=1 Tax=Mycolicibacterium conceptionense TaxID=451644 RepID=A0A0J8U0L3_9MYCO|nr:hypothetical protein [Mycolicibacterium conceptionense]KMV14842.1 hypothetical protein ACT17_28330 [Mycolicibacterium conceptionense]